MKKSVLIYALIVCLILPTFVLVAQAHPGRTDSSGGHTDISTGEYHYHHGYSAHDHYDMDGDGVIDCPYNFNDLTGNSSGTSSSRSKNINGNSYYDYIPPETVTVYKDREVIKNVPYTPAWVKWALGFSLVLSWCLYISNRSKKDTIANMTYEHKNTLDEMQKSYDKKLAEKNALNADLETIRSKIADTQKMQKALLVEQNDLLNEIAYETEQVLIIRRMRCWAKKAPLDISFSENGMPVFWKPNANKPYGDYTVFVSPKSNIYHTDRFCSGYRAKEEHIFNVIEHYRPCRKCAEGFFDFTLVPDWYTSKEDVFDDPSIKVNWRGQ